jgi:hypothetical protein
VRDWIKSFLSENKMGDILGRFEELKKENFDYLKKESSNRNVFFRISEALIKKLNCNFSHSKQYKHSEENFKLMFASVLADLPKGMFERLCDMKNVFYICESHAPACVKIFKLDGRLEIDKGEELSVVVFPHDISSEMSSKPFLLGRNFIVHELIHVITGLNSSKEDEGFVNEIARTLGFNDEMDEGNKYEPKQIDEQKGG